MKHDIAKLKELAGRLERATGPMSGGEAADCAELLVRPGNPKFYRAQLALAGSPEVASGAAMTLVEMLLPGWDIAL